MVTMSKDTDPTYEMSEVYSGNRSDDLVTTISPISGLVAHTAKDSDSASDLGEEIEDAIRESIVQRLVAPEAGNQSGDWFSASVSECNDSVRLERVGAAVQAKVLMDASKEIQRLTESSISGVSAKTGASAGDGAGAGEHGVVLDLLSDNDDRDMIFDCASIRFDFKIFFFQF